jgi:hypothetical protein
MKAIVRLEALYWDYQIKDTDYNRFIHWAIERLQRNVEGNDLDVVMLAASTERDEAFALTETIVQRYCPQVFTDETFALGKVIVRLHKRYQQGLETVLLLAPPAVSNFKSIELATLDEPVNLSL